MIEQQPVFTAVRQYMQSEADLPQEGLRRLELAQFALGQEVMVDQFVERIGAEVPLGNPADGLNIAQLYGDRKSVV